MAKIVDNKDTMAASLSEICAAAAIVSFQTGVLISSILHRDTHLQPTNANARTIRYVCDCTPLLGFKMAVL